MRFYPLGLLLVVGCIQLDDNYDEDNVTKGVHETDTGFSDTVFNPGNNDSGGGNAAQAEACHPDIEGWADSWATWEQEVVGLVNEERASGADCGTYGSYPAAGPVEMNEDLRCAARYHSLWMAETDSFSHDSPGGDLGDDPWERIDSTEFSGQAVGENIAMGYGSAASVVQGWMDSDGHCSNIMNADATLMGVGYFAGGSYGHYWTQNFGL